MRGWRRLLPVSCFLGALLLLLAMLAGLLREERGRELVLIEDVSASMLAGTRPDLSPFLQALAPQRIFRIAVAAQPRLLTDESAGNASSVASGASALSSSSFLTPETLRATDLAAALELAASLPGTGRRRVLLVSDGRENRGDAVAAARRQADRMLVETVAGGGVPAPDVRVERFSLPAAASAGQPMMAEVVCAAAADCAAELALSRSDGSLLHRRNFTVGPYGQKMEIPLTLTGQGVQPVTATVRLTDGRMDRVPENDTARAAVWLRGGGEVLWVGGAPPAMLAAVAQPAQLSELDPARLERVRALVLDDVPAAAVAGRASLLASWVRAGGTMVVAGGEANQSPGDWTAEALRELLPVAPLPGTGLGVVFAVDASGSMGEDAQGKGKLTAAAAAVEAAVAGLGVTDRVGLVAFAQEARTLLPVQGAEPRRIAAALRELAAGGGTSIFAGALQGVRLLTAPGVRWQRGLVVLLTDGETAQKNEELTAAIRDLHTQLRKTGIRLAVVAVGEKIDEPALRRIVEGCGTLTRADWRRVELPAVLQSLVREGADPRWVEKLPLAGAGSMREDGTQGRDLAALAPELVARTLRLGPLRGWEEDRVLLAAQNGEPLAAGGRYGLGRVIVTGGVTGRAWGAAGEGFWRGLLEQAAQGAMQGHCRLESSGGKVRVVWRPVRERGGPYRAVWQPVGHAPAANAPRVMALVPAGDGTWGAAADAPAEGLYRVRVESPVDPASAPPYVWNPLAEGAWTAEDRAEFLAFGPDGGALERIALAGGGRLVFSPAQLSAWERVPMRASDQPPMRAAGAAAALLLLAAGFGLRGMGNRAA